MQLNFHTVLALALLRPTLALPDRRPTQTAFIDLTGDPLGFSPKPTGFVRRIDAGFFQRRATTASPGSICGYVSGNGANPVTCDSSAYCAVNANLGVFGCCSYYGTRSNGDFTFSGCAYQSSCIESTATDDCTGSCASNTLNGFCTESQYPYCQTFSLQSLSAFWCNSIPDYTIQLLLSPTTTFSLSSDSDAPTQGPSIGIVTVTVGPSASPSNDVGSSPVGTNNSKSGKSSVVGPAVGGAIGGLAVVLIAAGGAFWLRMKHNKNKAAAAAAGGAATGNAAGGGPGGNTGPGGTPGPVTGFYGGNEYQKVPQDPSGTEPGPPVYPGPQMAQTYSGNQNLQPSTFSEMPSSPSMTAQTHNSMYGSQQPISEIDGTSSTAPQSPLVGGAANAQRKSIGTSSLLSGSAGDKTELDSTSVSGQTQTTQAGPAGTVPTAAAAASSSSTQQQNGLGFQAGPVGDWNRPYHELE